MTRRKKGNDRPTREQIDTVEEERAEVTGGQLEEARQRAQRRAATELVVLKQKYADAEVARTMVGIERDQLLKQLRTAQATIEEMAKRLRGEDEKEEAR